MSGIGFHFLFEKKVYLKHRAVSLRNITPSSALPCSPKGVHFVAFRKGINIKNPARKQWMKSSSPRPQLSSSRVWSNAFPFNTSMNFRFLFYFYRFYANIEISTTRLTGFTLLSLGKIAFIFRSLGILLFQATGRQTVNPIEWGTLISLWNADGSKCSQHEFASKFTKWIVALLWRIEFTVSSGPIKN